MGPLSSNKTAVLKLFAFKILINLRDVSFFIFWRPLLQNMQNFFRGSKSKWFFFFKGLQTALLLRLISIKRIHVSPQISASWSRTTKNYSPLGRLWYCIHEFYSCGSELLNIKNIYKWKKKKNSIRFSMFQTKSCSKCKEMIPQSQPLDCRAAGLRSPRQTLSVKQSLEIKGCDWMFVTRVVAKCVIIELQLFLPATLFPTRPLLFALRVHATQQRSSQSHMAHDAWRERCSRKTRNPSLLSSNLVVVIAVKWAAILVSYLGKILLTPRSKTSGTALESWFFGLCCFCFGNRNQQPFGDKEPQ